MGPFIFQYTVSITLFTICSACDIFFTEELVYNHSTDRPFDSGS